MTRDQKMNQAIGDFLTTATDAADVLSNGLLEAEMKFRENEGDATLAGAFALLSAIALLDQHRHVMSEAGKALKAAKDAAKDE